MKSEPTLRQQTCPHPEVEVHRFADGITICYHCYGLLDENLTLVSCLPSDLSADRQDREEDNPAQAVYAA